MSRAAGAVVGVVLAAGAGTRFGGPKALARTADGTPWVERVARALRGGGADRVVVALGAGRDEAAALVPGWAQVVHVPDWPDGVSASLRRALTSLSAVGLDPGGRLGAATRAVVVATVDVPDLAAEAVGRVVAGATPGCLRQATYGGRPGHPVLIGRAHWAPLLASVAGDVGARPYLVTRRVLEVPCDDLWHGHDVDGQTDQSGQTDHSRAG
ncbi:nucleotidyltransferase family protein [Luteimicrobium subarcticum]|uniref:Molybdenum cofactor cytidylyltransferase n=1 Tax=Luteimicrobium subarcticum TaxID=620910 RepID=A0A2M8W1C5_9MICO|nr:nucleotidyltransferase family protein [Luteimicrobium subarcticum]PJI84716.1 molybdenum cofactor cytidylyltransferase [Luteimicrobium subarcticum]